MKHMDFVVWMLGAAWYFSMNHVLGCQNKTAVMRLMWLVVWVVVAVMLWRAA